MRLTIRSVMKTMMAMLIMVMMVAMSMAKDEMLRSNTIIMTMLMCRR